jgi:ABC-2 type transport system ATP-binding protein/lipopolysaccharide transport system ATP-binding protein
MKEPIIEIKNVSLDYVLVNPKIQSIKDFVTTLSFRKLFMRKHVIDGLNLKVNKGEVVGIIGKNGTGKSTLLKAIAGILEPRKGEIIIRGKVAPLLALGSGIEPELTGYENIKLLGSLMGNTKKEMGEMNQKVIAFSELTHEQLLNPVKSYSYGMISRLSFSIAISKTPEVLIIDEVLAVGDYGFQQKCYRRIEEIQSLGGTILFVSHSLDEVKRVCSRGICLHEGKIVKDGDIEIVGDFYNSLFDN